MYKEEGVIHRDLAPSHFYLAANEEYGVEYVFVIDLGCAIFLDESQQIAKLNNASNIGEINTNYFEGSLQYAVKEILKGIIK